MTRRIFYSDSLNDSFLENGYVVVDFLGEDQMLLLKAFYAQQPFVSKKNFYLTLSEDVEKRTNVHKEIIRIEASSYNRILDHYKPVISSFAVKKPGKGSAWHAHQDDTFIDEELFVSLSIWTPLMATDSANGTLKVFPQSHKKYMGPRSPNIPQPFQIDLNGESETRMIDIDLKEGQAIIFDHRLIHASGENETDIDRVAAVIVLVPEEANLIYVYLDKNTDPPMIKQYAISEKYYQEAPLAEYSKEPNSEDFILIGTYPFVPGAQK